MRLGKARKIKEKRHIENFNTVSKQQEERHNFQRDSDICGYTNTRTPIGMLAFQWGFLYLYIHWMAEMTEMQRSEIEVIPARRRYHYLFENPQPIFIFYLSIYFLSPIPTTTDICH